MVVHIFSIVFTGFMFWLSSPGSDLFSWHPLCMTVAFVLLVLQAIVIFSPESSLFPSSPRNEKIQLHWILHSFGLVSAIFGFGVVYLNKEIHNRRHFTTWHGTFGLATCVCSLLVALGGLAAKYAQSLKAYVKPINMKMYHATAGLIVFTLAMTTVGLAFYSNWFRNRISGWAWRGILWVPVILGICIARQVTQSYLPRVLEPRESEIEAKARLVQERVEAKLKRQKEKKLQQLQEQQSKSKESEDQSDESSSNTEAQEVKEKVS